MAVDEFLHAFHCWNFDLCSWFWSTSFSLSAWCRTAHFDLVVAFYILIVAIFPLSKTCRNSTFPWNISLLHTFKTMDVRCSIMPWIKKKDYRTLIKMKQRPQRRESNSGRQLKVGRRLRFSRKQAWNIVSLTSGAYLPLNSFCKDSSCLPNKYFKLQEKEVSKIQCNLDLIDEKIYAIRKRMDNISKCFDSVRYFRTFMLNFDNFYPRLQVGPNWFRKPGEIGTKLSSPSPNPLVAKPLWPNPKQVPIRSKTKRDWGWH